MIAPPPNGAAALRLALSRAALMRCLVVVIAILTVLSVAEQYLIHIMGRADLEEFLIAVDLDAEANLPTWYASVTLLGCALMLGAIARRARRAGERFSGHWAWLSGLFVCLSIDEIAQLHEHLGRLQSVWHTHGLFYFAWVIPGAAFVALVGLAYARFLAHLPPAMRARFVIAAIVYLVGVLGVEAISGWRAERMGMNNMTHSLIATIEEVLEMSGVALFIDALFRHLSGGRDVLEIAISARAADETSARGH